VVTDEGMIELRSRLPYADLGAFDGHRRLESVTDLFTVGLLTRYVAWKLIPTGARTRAITRSLPGFRTPDPTG
jgi:hypothetical protein